MGPPNVFIARRLRAAAQEAMQTQHDVAVLAAAQPTHGLSAPNLAGGDLRMHEFVEQIRKDKRKNDTSIACDSKRHEFEQFCEMNCPNDNFKHNMNAEKCCRFMFYQAMREKKKTGGKQKGVPKPKFDQAQCKQLTDAFFNPTVVDEHGSPVFAFPNPNELCGHHAFAQHRTVVKNIHTKQQSKGCNSIPWDLVWIMNCKVLEKHVKERKRELEKKNFAEKLL